MTTVLSLCTGYGGLETALALAGVDVELVAVADPHPAAARLLAHHHPDVPNLGNITTVDWTRAPRADVITAGYPCQPFSLAGRRAGANDERAIWDDIHAAIRDLRPGTVLLENVPGHLSLGFGRVVGDLAAIGYVGSWRCVRASDVGAPHRRERVFILAWPSENGGPGIAADVAGRLGGAAASAGDLSLLPTPRASDTGTAGRRCSPGFRPPLSEVLLPLAWRGLPTPRERDWKRGGKDGLEVALLPTPRTSDAQGPGTHGDGGPDLRTAVTLLPTPRATDGTNGGPNQRGSSGDLMLPSAVQSEQWGTYAPAIARWENILGRPAPDPTEDGAKGNQRLSARFVEWMQGLPVGWVCDVPGISRNDQLRLLGNGVVAQQAELVIRQLIGATS